LIKNNKFYVYIYLDPRKPGFYNYGDHHFDYEPFYVGKVYRFRLFKHLHSGDYKSHLRKNRIIKNILKSNLVPVIGIIDSSNEESLMFRLEEKLIQIIGRSDLDKGSLANLTNGGEGPSGAKRTEAMSIARSIRMTGSGNHQFGKIHPNTHKALFGPKPNRCGSKNGRYGTGFITKTGINPMRNPESVKKAQMSKIKTVLIKLKSENLELTKDNYSKFTTYGLPRYQNREELINSIWISL
jgi:hypothetical protein